MTNQSKTSQPSKSERVTGSQHKYEVRLGHNVVTVEANDQVEALEMARRQLCLENPRLWDVINSLDNSRFEIADAA